MASVAVATVAAIVPTLISVRLCVAALMMQETQTQQSTQDTKAGKFSLAGHEIEGISVAGLVRQLEVSCPHLPLAPCFVYALTTSRSADTCSKQAGTGSGLGLLIDSCMLCTGDLYHLSICKHRL